MERRPTKSDGPATRHGLLTCTSKMSPFNFVLTSPRARAGDQSNTSLSVRNPSRRDLQMYEPTPLCVIQSRQDFWRQLSASWVTVDDHILRPVCTLLIFLCEGILDVPSRRASQTRFSLSTFSTDHPLVSSRHTLPWHTPPSGQPHKQGKHPEAKMEWDGRLL